MTDLTRRQFMTAAAGLQVGVFLTRWDGGWILRTLGGAGDAAPGEVEQAGTTLTAWLQIAPDGTTTVWIPRPEIGQGVRTSSAMLVAEELEVPWESVRVEQAPASDAFGPQGVGGSGTTRQQWVPLRQAGAAARLMLVAAAAARWRVPVAECVAAVGVVRHEGSGRSATYGELVADAASQPVPPAGTIRLKSPADFRIIGQPTPRVDNPAVVTGSALYGIDVRVPDLRFAVVARAPTLGATLEGYDEAAARAVPGVVEILSGVGGGVAVVATNTWAALQGRAALAARWDTSANADLDDAVIRARLAEAAGTPPAVPPSAATQVDALFELPFLAHATMEPMNCTIRVNGTSAEVWAPCQNPQSVRRVVASRLGLQESQVEARATLAGGGFGRRSATDYVEEAAVVARAVGGAVQLLWTREDDMRYDSYRPASTHALRGGLDAEGAPVSWSHTMAIASRGRDDVAGHRPPGFQPDQGGQGLYRIPGFGTQSRQVGLPVPTMVWRSVQNSQINFAEECFVDMLAVAAHADPVAFRRALLTSDRMRRLLDRAADEIAWSDARGRGTGVGIACFSGYGSLVAQAAEVEVSPQGFVRVVRVVCAVDCGVAINPSTIRAQMEGAVSDGVATTLKVGITVDGGAIEQDNFYAYDLVRMSEMPKVDVFIADSTQDPGGMGELGYPAVSPAICNAIAAATGRRVMRLPVVPDELAGWDTGGATPTPVPEQLRSVLLPWASA